MTLAFVIMLWVFAIGTIVMGAFRKTSGQTLQDRLNQFKPVHEGPARRAPIDLLGIPGKGRQPFVKAILSLLKRVGDPLTRAVPTLPKIEADLAQAGSPFGLGAIEFLGVKAVFASIGFLLPLVFASKLKAGNPSAPLMLTIVVAMMGWVVPSLWLKKQVKERRISMKVALPDLIDLIIISMDAGIGFDGALGRAVEKIEGPLTDEMARVLNDISHGKPRSEAFRDMATRAKLEDLSLLLAAINQSEQLGTSIGTALRIQAHEIRRRRTQELREMAAKLPVKMLIPLVLFIFPALLLIILGPAAVLLKQSGIF